MRRDRLESRLHIAIEGPIGAGKTSLARILAEELDAKLVLEEAENNPFLPDFYRNPRRFALQTQLCFLLSRHRQQSELAQINLFDRILVSDYIFEKDTIFASLTLENRELELYRRIADQLVRDITPPDLVVYLQSTAERLLTNIRIRDVSYERTIDEGYLRDLCENYNRFFFHWEKSSLLIVNVAPIDFVHDREHRRRILEFVRDVPSGITFFNPEA